MLIVSMKVNARSSGPTTRRQRTQQTRHTTSKSKRREKDRKETTRRITDKRKHKQLQTKRKRKQRQKAKARETPERNRGEAKTQGRVQHTDTSFLYIKKEGYLSTSLVRIKQPYRKILLRIRGIPNWTTKES